MRFERQAVLSDMRQRAAEGHAVIVTAAGAGLIARVEDKAGADAIVVYNSGLYRMNGIASIAGNLPIGDANAIVREMGRTQILNAVKNTPVVAGIYGVDPTRNMQDFLQELAEIGYSGVINFPTVGKLSGPIRAELEQVGLGFAREVEALRTAAGLGFFTMAYCYCPEEARILADAGVDILVSHVGLTAGGEVGVRTAAPLEAAAQKTAAILTAGLDARADIIPLCHGGPIATAQDLQYVCDNTPAVGFVAASSIERLPVEGSVADTVSALRAVRLPGAAR